MINSKKKIATKNIDQGKFKRPVRGRYDDAGERRCVLIFHDIDLIKYFFKRGDWFHPDEVGLLLAKNPNNEQLAVGLLLIDKKFIVNGCAFASEYSDDKIYPNKYNIHNIQNLIDVYYVCNVELTDRLKKRISPYFNVYDTL